MSLKQWHFPAPPYARFSLAPDGSVVLLFTAGYEKAVLSHLRAAVDTLQAQHEAGATAPQPGVLPFAQPAPAQFAGQPAQNYPPQAGQALMPPTYAPPAAHTQNQGFSPYAIQPPAAGANGAPIVIRPPPPPHGSPQQVPGAGAPPMPQGGYQAPVLPQPPVAAPPAAPDVAIRPVPAPVYQGGPRPVHQGGPQVAAGHYGGQSNPYSSAKARVPLHTGPIPRNGIAITPQGPRVIGPVQVLPQPELMAPPAPPADPNAPPIVVAGAPVAPGGPDPWAGRAPDVADAEFEPVAPPGTPQAGQ